MRLNLFTSPIILLLLLSAAGFQASARAQRRDRNSGQATISGRVTIEGKPASGVVVTATRMEGVGETRNYGDTTDVEGRFNIVGVTPGAYAITPQAYAFVLSNRDPNTPNSKRVVVGDSEAIDGVSLEMVRGCVVTGRVIDEDGNPVVGASISLGKPRRDGTTYIEYFNSPLPGAGETDDRGVYRIFGVPAGSYLVRVFVNSGPRRDSLNYSVFYPNTRDESKAKVIELSAGEEKTDISITVVMPEKTYSVSGRLIDAAGGKPVPYVLIWHQPVDDAASTDIFQDFIDNRITDEEGGFRIAGLLSGRYRIFTSTISDRDTEWYSDDLTVDVAGEDLSGIELKAHHGASISGVITIEGANDQRLITTPAGFTVIAYSSNNSEDLSGRTVAYRVSASGKFRLPGLRAGAVRLSVMTGGGHERSLSMERVEVAGQPVSDTFDLKEGQSIPDARIVMVYGDGVVRGQVKFQNGEPPENACFFVHTSRRGACLNCFRDFQARVSAGGQYTLEGLPPGDYELTLLGRPCGAGGHPKIAPVKQAVRVANGVEARADFVVDLNRKDQ